MTALAGRRPAMILTTSRTTEGSSAPSAPFVGSFRSTMSAPWLIASSASRLPVTLANNIVINALHRASHYSVERRVSGLLGGVVRRLVNIDLELNKDWQSDRESEQNQRRTLVVNISFIRVSALALTILFELAATAQARDPLDIKIGYLRRPQQQETISLVQ